MRSNRTILSTLLLGVLAAVVLSACQPQAPVDEPKNKLHDDPARMEITLFRTHFHGMAPHVSGGTKGVKHGASEQTMVLELQQGKGFVINKEKGVSRFVVTGNLGGGLYEPAGTYPSPVDPAKRTWTDDTFRPEKYNAGYTQYGMIIKYFNNAGEEITGQFATGGQEKIHQHFFIAKNIRWMKNATDRTAELKSGYEYLYYYYFDTDPWDKLIREGARYTGISNPIGLKGYLEFYQPETSFDLNILLLHARGSKYNSSTGKPSPFTGPTPGQRQKDDFDINITVPVVIYANENELENLEFEDFDHLSPKEQSVVRRLAEAAGVSDKEAFESLYNRSYGELLPHDPKSGLGL